MTRRHRRGAHFVMDVSRYCRPLDRNERARIMFLAKQLEERTVPIRLTRTPTICCGCRTHTLSGRSGPGADSRDDRVNPRADWGTYQLRTSTPARLAPPDAPPVSSALWGAAVMSGSAPCLISGLEASSESTLKRIWKLPGGNFLQLFGYRSHSRISYRRR